MKSSIEPQREKAERAKLESSATRALAAARDYLEIAELKKSPIDQARAHLLLGIAERRRKERKLAQSHYRHAEEVLAELPDENVEAKGLQVEILLERAIAAFVDGEYLDSARLNDRAAQLSLVLRKPSQASRALLNSAISWERVGEKEEAFSTLDRGEKVLAEVAASSLHASYALFRWKMELDYGPIRVHSELPSEATQSQKTLEALYRWEGLLLTSDFAAVEAARSALIQRSRELREFQFEMEVHRLEASTRFFFLGEKDPVIPGVKSVVELLDKRSRGRLSETPEGFPTWVAGCMRELLTSQRWKALDGLAKRAENDLHPVIRAWGRRALFWCALKGGKEEEARLHADQAARIARDHGLGHFLAELAEERGEASSSPGRTSWERQAYVAIRALSHKEIERSYLRVDNRGKRVIAETEVGHELAADLGRRTLLINGLHGEIGIQDRVPTLQNAPLLRKLLFSLIANYPRTVSKEELVGSVWEETYNPLIHDGLFHRAVARLRRVHSRLQKEILWSGNGLCWKGQEPFVALIPAQEQRDGADRLSERQLKVLSLLKYRGSLNRGEILKALDASERTVVREISNLVDRKLVLRVGAGPSVRYLPAR